MNENCAQVTSFFFNQDECFIFYANNEFSFKIKEGKIILSSSKIGTHTAKKKRNQMKSIDGITLARVCKGMEMVVKMVRFTLR